MIKHSCERCLSDNLTALPNISLAHSALLPSSVWPLYHQLLWC